MTQQGSAKTDVSQRAAASAFLAFIGIVAIGIGVGVLYGGAWASVVVGGVFVLFALVLALPAPVKEATIWSR